MKNKIKIVSVLTFLVVSLGVIAAYDIASVTEVYPEDYSFRSGLELESEIIGVGVHQREFNYWNTRYPFRDPNQKKIIDSDEEKKDYYNYFSKDNIGFKYSILRTVPGWDARGGKLQTSLAVVPYLQAKKMITYDGGSIQAGVDYEYDKFGQIKKTQSYGAMLGDFNRDFQERLIFDPNNKVYYYSPTPMKKSTAFTNFQGIYSFFDLKLLDNVVTETTYQYERYPLYKDKPGNNYPDAVRDSKDIRSAYQLMNWVDLPYEVVTKDAIGRKVSNSEYNFLTYKGGYSGCGVVQKDPQASCVYYNPSSETDCYVEVEDGVVKGCGSGENNFCVRRAIAFSKQKPELAGGFDERHKSDIGSYGTYTYDDCGNVVGIGTTQPYVNPIIDNSDGLSYHNKIVRLEYDHYKANPTTVTITPDESSQGDAASNYGTDSIQRSANVKGYGYVEQSWDEHGVLTNYVYDELGRITGIGINMQVLVTYGYEQYRHDSVDYLKIKEIRFVSNDKKITSYHFYDGAGNHIQTQTCGGNGECTGSEAIVVSKEYDVLGRVISETKPIAMPNKNDFGNLVFVMVDTIEYEYDALNRIIRVKNYDDTYVTKDYSIQGYDEAGGFNGYFVESVTDEEDHKRTFMTDSRGNLVFVEIPAGVVDPNTPSCDVPLRSSLGTMSPPSASPMEEVPVLPEFNDAPESEIPIIKDDSAKIKDIPDDTLEPETPPTLESVPFQPETPPTPEPVEKIQPDDSVKSGASVGSVPDEIPEPGIKEKIPPSIEPVEKIQPDDSVKSGASAGSVPDEIPEPPRAEENPSSPTLVPASSRSVCLDYDKSDRYTKGTTIQTLVDGRKITKYDTCTSDNKKVLEYYCTNTGTVKSQRLNCDYGCEDGACLKTKLVDKGNFIDNLRVISGKIIDSITGG